MDKYVVLIVGAFGRPIFLVDSDEEPCMFDSRDDAITAAEGNEYARVRGYQVKTWIYTGE
jgi:hypothetical protein